MRALKMAALVVGVGMVAGSSFAAIPWNTPNGSIPGVVNWSNGGSDNGLFGNPVVTANSGAVSFKFFPVDFAADSLNGVADIARDRMFVTLDLPNLPFLSFDAITVSELGDYSILGTGQVAASGLLTVTTLSPAPAPGSFPEFAQLVTNPVFPVSSGVNQTWTGNASVNLADNPGVRSIQIVLNNVLQATSAPGGSAFIQKKNAGVEIIIRIPEPATAVTLIAGAGLMLVRRRG